MKRYIKTNIQNQITKLFTWHNRPEFDGSEIEFDENGHDVEIDGKGILNAFDTPIFTWDGSSATERSQLEIDSDVDFIQRYKIQKRDQLLQYIRDNMYDINRTLATIRTQWASFKSNASSWTTKQQIDNAYDAAIVWLHS